MGAFSISGDFMSTSGSTKGKTYIDILSIRYLLNYWLSILTNIFLTYTLFGHQVLTIEKETLRTEDKI